jgi:hypothetical protein
MSSVSLPVTRPAGQALVVGLAASRDEPAKLLRRQGFHCHEVDDPYGAMAELARPGAFHSPRRAGHAFLAIGKTIVSYPVIFGIMSMPRNGGP